MDIQLLYEFVGYAASVLIAISLMMSSILKLRIINLVGAVLFTVYGLAIHAYPVAAVNFFIVLINLYYLYQIYTAKEYFKVLPVNSGSDFLRYFLDFHEKDILSGLPDFSYTPTSTQSIYFILRDMVPAGLVVAEPLGEDALMIQLDFAIPGYRDFKTGRYLFKNKGRLFTERGIHTVYSLQGSAAHAVYLRRMGFRPAGEQEGKPLYRLDLG